MTPYLRPAALALVLGLAFIAPGCDDEEDTTTNPAPIESPTPAPTPTPTPTPTPSPSAEPTPTAGQEVVFIGRIQAINDDGSFRISSRDVVTNSSTSFDRNGSPAGAGDFRVGDVVRVRGTEQGDGTVLAARIVLQPSS